MHYLIEWNPTLVLGVKLFDEHHEHLVFLLNKTYDLVVSDAPAESYDELFRELKDYAVYHFNAEELWMHEHEYPRLQTHLDQHESFMHEVLLFEKELDQGKSFVTVGLLTFIKEWLLHHIYKIDSEYAVLLVSRGIPEV
jgi:hemerythrin-like metal-binding protein